MIVGTETAKSLLKNKQICNKSYPESRPSPKAATTLSYLDLLCKFYTFAITEDDSGNYDLKKITENTTISVETLHV